VIEAVDSLLPYMHARGVAYMSTTARRRHGSAHANGRRASTTRRAGSVHSRRSDDGGAGGVHFAQFEKHPIHDVLQAVGKMRPTGRHLGDVAAQTLSCWLASSNRDRGAP